VSKAQSFLVPTHGGEALQGITKALFGKANEEPFSPVLSKFAWNQKNDFFFFASPAPTHP
jgi:hypothetical protein